MPGHSAGAPQTVVNRRRAVYVALAVATIAVGLLVHWRGSVLGTVVRDMAGDALWAMMITWWIGALTPATFPLIRGAAAYAVCVCVEVSQLYHTARIDAFRQTLIGALVLGSGFDPRDLAAYAAGVAAAVLLDYAVILRSETTKDFPSRRRPSRSVL